MGEGFRRRVTRCGRSGGRSPWADEKEQPRVGPVDGPAHGWDTHRLLRISNLSCVEFGQPHDTRIALKRVIERQDSADTVRIHHGEMQAIARR